MRHGLAFALTILLLASPAAASPCTNNNWQPTFVHDLDNEDGPYYVTASMTFIPLRWVPNGGYVPHACELVRGPQDTRNPRGYTNCQQYTRIQCGCSRSIPGNDTCAAFLRWHPATPPQQPGQPGTAGGALPPTPVAPPIATPPGAQPVPPIAQPQPPATPPSGPTNVPASGWQQAAQYRGSIAPGPNGLVLGGGAWTNGRLTNGFYDGNRVFSTQAFDFGGGGDAYMQLIVDGGGKYMGFYPRVLEGASVHFMSTHHSWSNSVVVKDGERVFAHIHVQPGGGYQIRVARGNYEDRGGQIMLNGNGQLPNTTARLELQFVDNYAGTGARITIAETLVRLGSGGPVPVAQPQPTGQRRGLPAGAACSNETECASSICLLGVCAP